MLASAWQHRDLIKTLSLREILGRYRGSYVGILWSFLTPVLMLAVYTFVFSSIFKARWNAGSDSKTEFALILFAGLLVFNLFSECIGKAPTLILSNVNYVKKVIFPLEILPWVALATALFHFAISLVVWLLAHVIFFGIPPFTVLWLPLVLTPIMLMIMGLSWALAALGVYLRDISQLVGVGITALMFLSPIFYPITALPERFQFWMSINPISPAVEMTRGVLYTGRHPDPSLLAGSLAMSAVLAWLGYAWFQKTRKGFADVV